LSIPRLTTAAALCSASIFLIAPPARASTNFVQNGNFETVSGNLNLSFSLEAPNANENDLTDWTLGNTSALTGNQILNCVVMGGATTNMCGTVEFGGNFSLWVNPGESPSPDGGNYYMADGDSSATDSNGGYAVPLYQTINGLSVGGAYTLSFEQAAGQQTAHDGSTTEQWEVEFCTTLPAVACTGKNNQTSTLMNDVTHQDIAWNSQTMTFTTTAASEVLEFIALGTPNGEPPFVLLDGVNLQAAPEPAAFALIGFGLLAIPLVARLRRKRR
jgi:hypothetical protein